MSAVKLFRCCPWMTIIMIIILHLLTSSVLIIIRSFSKVVEF